MTAAAIAGNIAVVRTFFIFYLRARALFPVFRPTNCSKSLNYSSILKLMQGGVLIVALTGSEGAG